jgi:hypothetical protein
MNYTQLNVFTRIITSNKEIRAFIEAHFGLYYPVPYKEIAQLLKETAAHIEKNCIPD